MLNLVRYEIKNTLGNIFSLIFGIFFPILMTYIIYFAASSQVPPSELHSFALQLFVTNLLISPLALVLIGFSALFSQEIEKEITLRMVLFGISEKKQLISKFLAQMFALLFASILYIVSVLPLLQLSSPSPQALLLLIICILTLSTILFLLAYSITLLARKFSITYGITMTLYFLIMILSGMMGIRSEQLPDILKYLANLMPTTQLINTLPKLWTQDSINLIPLLQSFIFLGAMSGVLYFVAIQKQSRSLK